MPEEMDKYFNLGYKSSRFAPLGNAIKSTIAAYNQQNQLESGLAAKAGMERLFQDPNEARAKAAQARLYESQANVADTQREMFNKMGQGGGVNGYKLETIDTPFGTLKRTPTKEEITQEADIKRQAQGIPAAEIGKVALAKESIKNIEDVKKLLFPRGTASSFKRSTAFASNLPGGTLPILPQRAWGKAEQDVFRKMGAAISGRQLIQTGVAARPEETAKLVAQFAPSGGSNPEAALSGLNELQNFYKDYLNTVTTRSIGDINEIPSGIDPSDWERATPQEKEDYLRWKNGQ